jgi:inner membrane transporter RhtA
MVCDVLALRRVPARFYGVFMSVNPVFAVLTGLVILRQSLGLADWLAITVSVTVNAAAAGGAAAGDPRGPVAGDPRDPAIAVD